MHPVVDTLLGYVDRVTELQKSTQTFEGRLDDFSIRIEETAKALETEYCRVLGQIDNVKVQFVELLNERELQLKALQDQEQEIKERIAVAESQFQAVKDRIAQYKAEVEKL